MLGKELVRKSLVNMIDALDTNSSDWEDFEMYEILDTINEVTNTKNKLSKYQACEYLDISRATFDNYVKAGKIPEGSRQIGFKEKFWTKAQLKKFKDEYRK